MNINININLNKDSKTFNLNFTLLAILILSILLRFYHLGFQGAWVDEIHTLKEADPNLSLKQLYDVVNWREGIPHLYFLIVRCFSLVFCHSLYTIRLVSVVFGVLAVYCMYLLGKSISSKQTGYIAAFLLAIHPFHIEYSQEGRSYSFLMLFVIFSFYRLSVYLKESSLKNAVILGLGCGLITNAQPIGIVTVISIYLIVAVNFLIIVQKSERLKYIKNSFLSLVLTLIIFSPVYQIVVKASKLPSFWVPKPSFDYVVYVLQQISGGNIIILYIFLATILTLFILAVVSLITYKNIKNNRPVKQFAFVFMWVVFYFLFILIKSLGPSSLMLHRYLSPIVPGLILAVALLLSNIRNKIIVAGSVFLFASLLLYTLFIKNDFYNTRYKSQFNILTERINTINKSHETVISYWGWLLTYFIDREDINKNVYEKNLDLYINDVRTNLVIQENFWYADGNSRPYSVAPETQEFLDKNYSLDKTIELNDCWARHYISKKPVDLTNKTLKLNQFSNGQLDGSGHLLFFENSKSTSVPIFINKGNYSIIIKAMSLPEKKIDNENAKIKISVNNKFYKLLELSEKQITDYQINYSQAIDGNIELGIEFINDYAKENLDRNALISNINIKKIN